MVLIFQYGKTYHSPEEQGGWDVTAWYMYVVEGCCTRVKLMSFEHSGSLDIILADRDDLSDDQKQGARTGKIDNYKPFKCLLKFALWHDFLVHFSFCLKGR